MNRARPLRRAWLAAASGLVVSAAVTLAACQSQPSAEPLLTVPVAHAYTICPPGGELPAQEATDRAVAILGQRLALLGFDAPRINVGACIEVEVPITPNDAAVQAALLATGEVELVPIPADQADGLNAGGSVPDGLQPLVATADIDSGEVQTDDQGQPQLLIGLSNVGSAALANWSRVHVNEPMALVVDGVVIAIPTMNEPITTGQVAIAFGSVNPPPIPVAAIAAMIESGPLPPEWAQPERPQG